MLEQIWSNGLVIPCYLGKSERNGEWGKKILRLPKGDQFKSEKGEGESWSIFPGL